MSSDYEKEKAEWKAVRAAYSKQYRSSPKGIESYKRELAKKRTLDFRLKRSQVRDAKRAKWCEEHGVPHERKNSVYRIISESKIEGGNESKETTPSSSINPKTGDAYDSVFVCDKDHEYSDFLPSKINKRDISNKQFRRACLRMTRPRSKKVRFSVKIKHIPMMQGVAIVEEGDDGTHHVQEDNEDCEEDDPDEVAYQTILEELTFCNTKLNAIASQKDRVKVNDIRKKN